MVEITRHEINPNANSLFGRLYGNCADIEIIRVVTDREIEEIKWLQFLGIRPNLFDKEPDLECAKVLNEVSKMSENDWIKVEQIYRMTEALLRQKRTSSSSRSRSS